jgi:2'-5' RNA ligase
VSFLGDVAAEQEVRYRRAASLVRLAPFSFQLNIASSFRETDAWWLGSRDASIELAELRQQLRNNFFGARVGADAKRYVPHVTFLKKRLSR